MNNNIKRAYKIEYIDSKHKYHSAVLATVVLCLMYIFLVYISKEPYSIVDFIAQIVFISIAIYKTIKIRRLYRKNKTALDIINSHQ